MGIAPSKFPTLVWDGSCKATANRLVDKTPDVQDWDQIVAEMISLQNQFRKAAVVSLTDNSGGTADNTVVAVRSDTLVNCAADCNADFADLSAKVNSILTTLRNCNIIIP